MRFTFAFILVLAALVSFAQEGFRGERFIEVIGTAESEIEPNELTVWIRLREFEENRNKVQLEKIDKDFLNALRDAGIDRKRLEIADAGTTLGKLGRRDKDAFREKTYQLKLNGAAELEKFVEKTEPVKIDLMRIVKVHHTEMEKIKMELKIKALQEAKSKAETLLRSINAEVGKPLLVREWDMPVQPLMETYANVVMRGKAEAAYDMAQQTPEDAASFRKIKLKAQVAAFFEIK